MRPRSILVVEDDEEVRALLLRWLREFEAELWAASRLAEALLLVQQRSPEVIILDLTLPDAQDLDALTALLPASQHRAAVLVITGHSDISARRVKTLGAEDILLKGSQLTGPAFREAVLKAYAQRQSTLRKMETARGD